MTQPLASPLERKDLTPSASASPSLLDPGGDDQAAANRLWPTAIFAVLLGSAYFWLVTGGVVLNPANVAWISPISDTYQHWIGWEFFRDTPALQWPLGDNPRFGSAVGGNIIFTDSIPLFALALKPFSAFLPRPFQYLGLWVLSCFILQAFFAAQLLSRLLHDRMMVVLGTVLFVSSAAMISRFHGHFALMSHWLILAGLCAYVARRSSPLTWPALFCIALLVHAYFMPMLAALWLADTIKRLSTRQLDWNTVLRRALTLAAVSLVVMWSLGYFSRGGGDWGYGVFRLNLAALVDGDRFFSYLLPDVQGGPGDYEGFAYLGTGALLLIPLATVAWLISKGERSEQIWWPLAVVAIPLTIYAVSNRIALGPVELLEYPIPQFWEALGSRFRASGRLFWPVYYMILLALVWTVARRIPRPAARFALCVGGILTIADAGHAYTSFRQHYSNTPAWEQSMTSPLWTALGQHYEHFAFVLPSGHPDRWQEAAHFAASHRMSINAGYLARYDHALTRRSRGAIAQQVRAGNWETGTLYVFQNDALWADALAQLGPDDLAGELDGWKVLAPGLGPCPACESAGLSNHLRFAYEPRLAAGLGASMPLEAGEHGIATPSGINSMPDSAGLMLTTPAKDLPPGHYHLTVEGHAASGTATVLEVISDGGATGFFRAPLLEPSAFSQTGEDETHARWEAGVLLGDYARQLQIRVLTKAGDDVRVSAIQLQPVKLLPLE
ncbi:MAG: DUF6311 domain-containing protein [Rhodocyclaceae bacterium]